MYGSLYRVQLFRPRIEGLFARIELWTNVRDSTDVFWRSISKDNITSWYGKTAESRIFDPNDETRIFSWLICEIHDDKGNVMVYSYKREDSARVSPTALNERNRSLLTRSANRYIKRISYGNHVPYFPDLLASSAPPPRSDWLSELVLDYGEHDAEAPMPVREEQPWHLRTDPFSSHRSGFEIRTYRLCERVLMFHHFPEGAEHPAAGRNYLVFSTDFVYREPVDGAVPTQPGYTVLVAVEHRGYQKRPDGGYESRQMPPLSSRTASRWSTARCASSNRISSRTCPSARGAQAISGSTSTARACPAC